MKLIDKSALVAEIERRRKDWRYGSSIEAKYKREECDDILSFLDTLEVKEVQEEPVSEDLERAARKIATRHSHITGDTYYANDAWFFKKGAQWQKEKMIDKACDWLSNVSIEDMSYKYDDFDTSEGWYKFIEDFRKAIMT